MGKWVCKMCGGDYFTETSISTEEGAIYDKDGCFVSSENSQDSDWNIECNCGCRGEAIEDIANWEDEE